MIVLLCDIEEFVCLRFRESLFFNRVYRTQRIFKLYVVPPISIEIVGLSFVKSAIANLIYIGN